MADPAPIPTPSNIDLVMELWFGCIGAGGFLGTDL